MDNQKNRQNASVFGGLFVGALCGILTLVAFYRYLHKDPLTIPHERAKASILSTTPSHEIAETAVGSPTADKQPLVQFSQPLEEEFTAKPSVKNVLFSAEEVRQLRRKLGRLALALLNFENAYQALPPGRGKKVNFGLSWRVYLLPYLDQLPLFERFNLTEPWDSPQNRELLQHMPEVYRTCAEASASTRFMAITGEQTFFHEKRPIGLRHARDGVSNSMLLVHAGAGEPVPWTKPSDIIFDKENPVASLGLVNGKIESVLADGSLLSLPGKISEETLLALVTIAGNEIVDGPGLRRIHGLNESTDGSLPLKQRAHFETKDRETKDRLKIMGMAMHNYESKKGYFSPASGFRMRDGIPSPPLSWRVQILPLLQQSALFQRYDANEAWNGTSNRELLQFMPGYFRSSHQTNTSSTRIQVFTGKGTLFDSSISAGNPRARVQGPRLREISDGTSNTLMIIEAGSGVAVPWTEPRDIKFDSKRPLNGIGSISASGIPVVMFDGSTKILSADIDPLVFKSLVLPNDGK